MVHPDFRHHGIGTQIMKAILERFKGTSFLLTTMQGIEEFYLKLGFQKVTNAMKIVRSSAV